MIILPSLKNKKYQTLLSIEDRFWMPSSQSRPKDDMGNEDVTKFRLRAFDRKGLDIWTGWFSDRQDFDAVLTAIFEGSIRRQKALWKLSVPEWHPDIPIDAFYEPKVMTFLSSYAGQVQEWVVPDDWCSPLQAPTFYSEGEYLFWSGQLAFFTSTGNDTSPVGFYKNRNAFEVIGGGGNGACVTFRQDNVSTTGGGGAAYARSNNLAISGGATVYYSIGAGVARRSSSGAGSPGGNTWVNIVSNAQPTVSTNGTSAQGGRGGNYVTYTSITAALGGQVASSIGDVRYAGGNANTTQAISQTASGGGGAGGPKGAGNSSPTITTASYPGSGGYGDSVGGAGGAGFGGAGGAPTSGNNPGGNGSEWAVGYGSGGGGAGDSEPNAVATGGNGGNYGGGGGAGRAYNAGSASSGAGIQGLAVISYSPAPFGFTIATMGM